METQDSIIKRNLAISPNKTSHREELKDKITSVRRQFDQIEKNRENLAWFEDIRLSHLNGTTDFFFSFCWASSFSLLYCSSRSFLDIRWGPFSLLDVTD